MNVDDRFWSLSAAIVLLSLLYTLLPYNSNNEFHNGKLRFTEKLATVVIFMYLPYSDVYFP